MAGKAGLAERMQRVGERLAEEVERGVQALSEMESPTDAAGVDRKMKAVRSAALAGRGVLALGADADRLLADDGDEGDGEIDDEEELDEDGLEALRRDVERRYARFDRQPEPPPRRDLGYAPGDAQGGAEGLGSAGARPSAAAA